MVSDASEDDSYMHHLALDLLERHERAARRTGAAATGDAAFDTLMPAVMATRHVIVWHVGHEPSPAEIESFAEAFPDWAVIDAVCSGRIEPRPCEEPDAEGWIEHEGREVSLVRLCRRFLDAYARRHLSEAKRRAGSAPAPASLPGARRQASGSKSGR